MTRRFNSLIVVFLTALLLAVALPALADDCQDNCDETGPDGRINPGAVEAAIYCTTRGVKIIDIDIRGVATDSFLVPYAAIDAVGVPEVNTLIAEHRGFRLYRLTTGELQLNAPPNWLNTGEYVFIWDGCDRSTTLEP